MSQSDFDFEELFGDDFSQVIDSEANVTPHTTVWCSNKLYNTKPEHQDKLLHIDMNIKFDESNPNMKEEYEKNGTTQMVVLPIRAHNCTNRIIDYSHDIFYRIYNKESTSVIDDFIRTINSDTVYCLQHPPFRFRYINVVVVIINSTTTSDYIYC